MGYNAFEDTEILEFNQYQKSDKTLSIIYTVLQSLIEIIDGCKNNSEKWFTTKVGEHIYIFQCLHLIWTFDGIEKKHDVYRGKHCMKEFRESLRDHAMKIFSFEKKKMIPLTNEQ